MKVEALCPDCDGAYLIEVEALEQGLPCPGCGRTLGTSDPAPVSTERPLEIDRPATAETAQQAQTRAEIEASTDALAATAPVPVTPVAPIPQPKAEAIPPAADEPAAAPAPAAAPTEVVCPRCNLHFRPRATTQARARETAERPTVLVVEDMEYFREIAAEALAGEYEVKAVATKDEAKAALEAGGIDLMVLDLTLDGGEGGLDLLHELSAKPCPVLIYTAQDENEMYGDQWDELKKFGADDIVLKGLSVGDELIRKVGSLLGKISDDDER